MFLCMKGYSVRANLDTIWVTLSYLIFCCWKITNLANILTFKTFSSFQIWNILYPIKQNCAKIFEKTSCNCSCKITLHSFEILKKNLFQTRNILYPIKQNYNIVQQNLKRPIRKEVENYHSFIRHLKTFFLLQTWKILYPIK